ncbi:hypothetical protein [Fischerella sp. PCC 9605]|uniref:hypothetical protein n=1 Tax=Fischerella sp. PCC 9605 TaxID=1173024 RepID=UPI0012DD35DA|nr:hypothetical protein [Fischerella sp. PCC 9605]
MRWRHDAPPWGEVTPERIQKSRIQNSSEQSLGLMSLHLLFDFGELVSAVLRRGG